MDLGLYQVKYPFRKLIRFLVPLALLPIGVLMAWCYWMALTHQQTPFLLYGAFLGLVRMVVATLDGLVASSYNKSTTAGDVLNRVTPELCDLLLCPVLLLALKPPLALALAFVTMTWAIGFFGLLGAPSGCPVQSVGPCGQTDRLFALQFFSVLEYLSRTFHWTVPFFTAYLYWTVLGGMLTLGLRFWRTLKAAQARDQNGQ